VEIVVNGTARAAAPGTSVAALLKDLGVAPERVAVERNLDIIDRERWDDTVLADGDRVEIIQFVGGGAGRTPGQFVGGGAGRAPGRS
jgi:thiamine biosynthesis protein ThiS